MTALDSLARRAGALLAVLAGYCNRLVHDYHEILAEELFEICTTQLGDVEALRDCFASWTAAHLPAGDLSTEGETL